MAAYPDIVEQVIDASTDADPPSETKVLKAIAAHEEELLAASEKAARRRQRAPRSDLHLLAGMRSRLQEPFVIPDCHVAETREEIGRIRTALDAMEAMLDER
jgi:hypothetical protein